MESTVKKPRVSVIMPAYNAARYVREAVQSILDQTFTDFEFLIIDDGSTDGTPEVLFSFRDNRMNISVNRRNLGMAANLNALLQTARGEYLVRMDADDISLPRRIETLVMFMDAHPDVGVCGSLTRNIGYHAGLVSRRFCESAEVYANLLFGTSLSHPSVIMRRDVFIKHNLRYDAAFNPADDYDLWCRAATVTKLTNVPKVLLHYRVHPESISSVRAAERQRHAEEIRLRQLHTLGLSPSHEEVLLHQGIRQEGMSPLSWLQKTETWFLKIRSANESVNGYEKRALDRVLAEHWFERAYAAQSGGRGVWWAFRKSPLYQSPEGGVIRTFKLLLACLCSWRNEH